ncbi:release factor glutamine methyltransferase [Halomicrobium zhouii]|uniref:Release factor glutamine methyltransferase n=1 Tax=Halomicrobium zhouii TaxID=767519 RepID=A0A1I6LPT7_9EURY|nr:HemK2/MTQ2 family protein methyltransferase [Halomicrobium zhouii]SFS05428.1 release factor glutamine methyltransferase [Halomicrobium zhouii]
MSDGDENSDGEGPQGGDRPSLADRRETPDVYQPAEDSHLLATAARERVSAGDRALDVGTGSGYVASALADAGATVVASDLNPAACEQAAERGLPVVRADLLGPFRDGAFDVVTFNPPYLPTDPDNEWGDWMERALSGGEDGRAAIDPFLDDLDRVLAPDGAAYLLVSSLTDPDAVRERATANGLTATEVDRESHPFETLLVLRLSLAGE